MNATVLYIEDNPTNVVLVKRLLSRRPSAELLVAKNGREGIAAAINDQPALILLDNQLPDASGGEVLGQLAAIPATAQIPVIIVSGDSSKSTIDELLAKGAVDFLVKPYDINKFLATIDQHLASGPATLAGDGVAEHQPLQRRADLQRHLSHRSRGERFHAHDVPVPR